MTPPSSTYAASEVDQIMLRRRYWYGRAWTGTARVTEGSGFGQYHLSGWRRFWYTKFMRNPVIFHVFAWFGCSVPLTRGRLRWLTQPREMRILPEVGRDQ
jgi:hypothetical protein